MDTKNIIYKNFKYKKNKLIKSKLSKFFFSKELAAEYPLLQSLSKNYNYSFKKKKFVTFKKV